MRMTLTLAALVQLAGAQAAAGTGFVADKGPEAVKSLNMDGAQVQVTRGRAEGKPAHRIMSLSVPHGAFLVEAGAAATRDQARAICRSLPPAGVWDLPDAADAFLAAVTVGALFGPEHFSRPVYLEQPERGRPRRGAYLVWLRGADEREERRLAGTDKLYMFMDGNGGADDQFIGLAEARAQVKLLMELADKQPADRRQEAQRQAKGLYDAVKDDMPVFCVSGFPR